ncbi:hypothetical protein [Sphingomonas sp. PAMC 26605]|uniref:hypothetical protein n=1 Tax=Sphingomonas sp. PAMC 26605 TaxID=1112214 RepID=UPI001E61C30B|nr:hypothetical protein [Sphingomonas sp. PAMC 26605]
MRKQPDPTPAAALLQGCSEKGHNRMPGQQAGDWPPRHCPECMRLFEPKVSNQLFCSPAHNADWNNRATKRGRVLTPLAMVARITRNGTRGTPEARAAGKRASSQYNALVQRYRDEDRKDERMEWAAFMILRYDHGFDPL